VDVVVEGDGCCRERGERRRKGPLYRRVGKPKSVFTCCGEGNRVRSQGGYLRMWGQGAVIQCADRVGSMGTSWDITRGDLWLER